MKRAMIIQHQCQCHILGSPTFTMKGGHLDEKPRDPLCQDTLILKTLSEERELNKPRATAYWKMPWHLVCHIPSTLDSYYTVNISHQSFSSLIAFFF